MRIKLLIIVLMERKFTAFCLLLAVIFGIFAYILGSGEMTVARYGGAGFCTFGAFLYVVMAIWCSRKEPNLG